MVDCGALKDSCRPQCEWPQNLISRAWRARLGPLELLLPAQGRILDLLLLRPIPTAVLLTGAMPENLARQLMSAAREE